MDLVALTEAAWKLVFSEDELDEAGRVRRRTVAGGRKLATTKRTPTGVKLKSKRRYKRTKMKLKMRRKKKLRSAKFRRRIKLLAKRAAARRG